MTELLFMKCIANKINLKREMHEGCKEEEIPGIS